MKTKFSAILLSFFAVLGATSCNRNKNSSSVFGNSSSNSLPINNTTSEVSTNHSSSIVSSSEFPTLEESYEELKEKQVACFSEFEDANGATWNELKILSVCNDDGIMLIESAVPVNDSDYEYCVFQSISNDKLDCDSLIELADIFDERNFYTTSSLVDDTYYTLSDDMQNMIDSICDAESSFFISNGIETYLANSKNNELHIYNTDTNKCINLKFSAPYKNVNESKNNLIDGEYKSYTNEDLTNDGYIFTYQYLNQNKTIKK